jgi:mRNA interferase MazF
MARKTYFPDRGHFVHLNFSPSAGHEMADHHYGIVISTASFSRLTGFAVVCPITSSIKPWPFYVPVPKGHLPLKGGILVESVIATDQVKSVDCRERGIDYVSDAPEEILDEVLAKVRAIIDSDDVVDELET